MKILADIGGTFSRFAYWQNEEIKGTRVYRGAEFSSMLSVLQYYCEEESITPQTLLIATAARNVGDRWTFINFDGWDILPHDIKSEGVEPALILNDFEAATWALSDINPEEYAVFKSGHEQPRARQCLTGPGTGLGLGFWDPTNTVSPVQQTHGGHIPLATVTTEHEEIKKLMSGFVESELDFLVFEHFVSGKGLFNLYRSVCQLHGVEQELQKIEALMEHKDSMPVREAVRLFTEFFAVFSGTVVNSGSAFGGLYLKGGVLQRLIDNDLFDFAQFNSFFTLADSSLVKHDLEHTPVFHLKAPCPALKGLVKAYEHQKSLSHN